MQQQQPAFGRAERFAVGIPLALVGGYLDSYTYITRGGVFANAQTGNIVLLGVAASQGRFRSVLYYLIPITAFVLGVWVVEALRSRLESSRLHWRQAVLLFEAAVLLAVALLPAAQQLNTLCNVLVSFVCAMQVEAFRRLHGNQYATTMCTGNLRSATELWFRYRHTRNPQDKAASLRYYGVILLFIAGAMVGAVLSLRLGTVAVLLCCPLLAWACMALREPSEDASKDA